MAKYDRFHREIPDCTPVSLPVGYERPESLESMIARMVKIESLKAAKEGKESFEESDDFDITDEEEVKFTSDHQFTDMQEEEIDHPRPRQPKQYQPGNVAPTAQPTTASSLQSAAQTPSSPPSRPNTSPLAPEPSPAVQSNP